MNIIKNIIKKNRNRLLQHLKVSDYTHKLETKTKVIIKNSIVVTF